MLPKEIFNTLKKLFKKTGFFEQYEKYSLTH